MSITIKTDANGAALIPAELCRTAGVAPGTDLIAEVEPGRIVLEPARPPIWERIAALAADAPSAELDKPPVDGATQLDHYLYGAAKKPD